MHAAMRKGIVSALLISMSSSAFMACGGSAEHKTVAMTGAGATFPYPIYSKWFDEYHKVKPEPRLWLYDKTPGL